MAISGASKILTVDGKYHVWTRRVGNGAIKVLTLHGGPGATHEYLETLERHLPQAGIELYYYEQLGSYGSDQPDDTSLWTIARFREEVEQVRVALGLENFYLYGQSWGGMLAIEYALKYQTHLAGLVISNMTASIADYVAYLQTLRAALPADIQVQLAAYEDAQDWFNPRYVTLIEGELYSQYMCRLKPWPSAVTRSFAHMAMPVYGTMQGPNEFVVTGTFSSWNRWDRLHEIAVPTLVLGARYDTMNPEDIVEMGRRIPGAQVGICENGSHLALWDDEEAYFGHLVPFLLAPNARVD